MARKLIVVADTWGHQQARAHEEELTVLTKSRWWLTKSSGGAGGLGDRAVEDDGDTWLLDEMEVRCISKCNSKQATQDCPSA